MSDDISYYKSYYERMGSAAYLGENLKTSSRMLVFCEWLRAELKPGARVLDIGCGDAIFAELMPEFHWYGVDINIERASARIPKDPAGLVSQTSYSRLVEQDLMKPPYPWPEKFFDAVISSEVLEHLWDLRVVHREAKRLLKREGLYVISTPNFDWIQNHLEHFRRIMQVADQHWTFEHIRHLNFDTHKSFLNECGFVIEKHTGADAHYCPIFANACRSIRDGLREQGTEVDEYLLQKWAGRGVPHYQHTIILSARKA
jgi:2-polyprenyl-3-methyl-5-hydroxy-6-metoxy-1,4-benzoquinol methylase